MTRLWEFCCKKPGVKTRDFASRFCQVHFAVPFVSASDLQQSGMSIGGTQGATNSSSYVVITRDIARAIDTVPFSRVRDPVER